LLEVQVGPAAGLRFESKELDTVFGVVGRIRAVRCIRGFYTRAGFWVAKDRATRPITKRLSNIFRWSPRESFDVLIAI